MPLRGRKASTAFAVGASRWARAAPVTVIAVRAPRGAVVIMREPHARGDHFAWFLARPAWREHLRKVVKTARDVFLVAHTDAFSVEMITHPLYIRNNKRLCS